LSKLPKEIDWTSEKVSSFKQAYKDSQKRKPKERTDMFEWKGYQFIPGYAKYLIEHLENNGL